MYRVQNYISINRSTKCRNCQTFGHHERKCSLPPVCPICAPAHTTSSHQRIDATGKGDFKYTHLPINAPTAYIPQDTRTLTLLAPPGL